LGTAGIRIDIPEAIEPLNLEKTGACTNRTTMVVSLALGCAAINVLDKTLMYHC
jgi:hypothetical protein